MEPITHHLMLVASKVRRIFVQGLKDWSAVVLIVYALSLQVAYICPTCYLSQLKAGVVSSIGLSTYLAPYVAIPLVAWSLVWLLFRCADARLGPTRRDLISLRLFLLTPSLLSC